tara:strand:- start:132 stop:479 length:348 start_codon:yes stop_codon:yes gene_type:complete
MALSAVSVFMPQFKYQEAYYAILPVLVWALLFGLKDSGANSGQSLGPVRLPPLLVGAILAFLVNLGTNAIFIKKKKDASKDTVNFALSYGITAIAFFLGMFLSASYAGSTFDIYR